MFFMVDPRRIQIYTLLITMVYLTFFHVRRYANPFVDELDFTVALMTLTQKMSRFAFEYHDGTVRSYQSLTPTQKSLAIKRPKYYFAWTLADVINNAAGFGYNGVLDYGEERWDLLSNLNILRIETATSFKMYIDNWNIQTAVWLKEVCYDRSPFNPLLSTFILSAAWHGVHPGYYFTFLTAVPVTLAARRVRQTIRPWFQHTSWSKLIYSLITWLCTQIAMSYTVAPFILLGLGPSLQLYRSLGFCLHIIPLVLLLILPNRKRHNTEEGSSKQPSCDRNYNHLKKET
ncbi:hypothetical protein GDO81_006037 [Engystomops pustulosus]|uniref:Uncharacterized protein n=1 Tax=Engystomops pustulosus TaxID=76066 RepID=A0AAV7CU15_ENGPU|nr:hypothetical protein GDO81_006037 [Engystomops pustulosus]